MASRMSQAGYNLVKSLQVGDTFQSKYGTGFINRMKQYKYIEFVQWIDDRALLAEWRLTPAGYDAAREVERQHKAMLDAVFGPYPDLPTDLRHERENQLQAEIDALKERVTSLEEIVKKKIENLVIVGSLTEDEIQRAINQIR